MDRFTGAVASVLFASSLACACVARGSWIRTPRGLRRIEDLEVGDEVYSVDPATGELVATRITAIRAAERECLELACGKETELVCTSDHPVYDPDTGEYADAGDWVSGERSALLFAQDDAVERREVTDAETFVGVHEVFDLTVDSHHHNFIADGVLVHNKSKREPRDCTVDGEEAYHRETCECGDARLGEVVCPEGDDPEGDELPEGECVCPSDAGDATDAKSDGTYDTETADSAGDAEDSSTLDGTSDTRNGDAASDAQ